MRTIGKFAAAFATAAMLASAGQMEAREFWLGADISGMTADEAHGRRIMNADGEEKETTQFMKDLGFNAVRLRVWVNPKDGFCSPEDVLKMARRAQDLSMPVMIDFHYSDWWADPKQQNIPEAWKDMSYGEMKEALADHTRSTLRMLADEGIDVRWVQIGNETSNGFLWETGRASTNPEQYAGLTKAGYDAAKEVYPEAQMIVHLDNGYDPDLYDWIFGELEKYGTQWDAIGMSVYPYWNSVGPRHLDEEQTLQMSIDNINRLGRKYGCDVIIVETGVHTDDPEGGKAFLSSLIEAAADGTDGICTGVWYWAPEADATGGYKLGAMANDRPTAILEAITEAAERLAAE